ncbi:hypothetical protein HZH66_014415 [Vespula vulgaris]|uniref:Uncharacterized protein n=1 Tax=Vespula vulgaris TaxID=7454 RepID=A0A834MPF5_VESVU|nr:hypothetical protein HZH66_014415 [Vespula vulgaris]
MGMGFLHFQSSYLLSIHFIVIEKEEKEGEEEEEEEEEEEKEEEGFSVGPSLWVTLLRTIARETRGKATSTSTTTTTTTTYQDALGVSVFGRIDQSFARASHAVDSIRA